LKHSPGEAALNLLCLTNKWHICQLGAFIFVEKVDLVHLATVFVQTSSHHGS